jgi:hypothetical protein
MTLKNLLFIAGLSSFSIFDGCIPGVFARPAPTTTPPNLVLDARDSSDAVQTTSWMTGYALEWYSMAVAMGTAPGNEATTFMYMGPGAGMSFNFLLNYWTVYLFLSNLHINMIRTYSSCSHRRPILGRLC